MLDLTRRDLVSVPGDSLLSMSSRHSLPILSRRMMSSLKKGKGFRARFASADGVYPGKQM